MSPAHHRSASALSGLSSFRRTQNLAAKAANARLAQVMASQAADDGEDEDDDGLLGGGGGGDGGGGRGFRYGLPRPGASGNGGASLFGRTTRSPSPAVIPELLVEGEISS